MRAPKRSTILTCIAAIGAVVTTVLAVRAGIQTKENEDKIQEIISDDEKEVRTIVEVVQDHWKLYIPTVVAGATTLTCIIAANHSKHRQQVALASAFNLLNSSYAEYKRKNKEINGVEAHNKVVEALAEQSTTPYIQSTNFCNVDSLDISDSENPEVIRMFHDTTSDRNFYATMSQVLQAEYHLNRNFVLRGYAFENEFYDFLGIYGDENGDEFGWTTESGIYWIDFNHRLVRNKKGEEYIIIEADFLPERLDEYDQ